ncbi:Uncharacterised protein [BD1-7 clade bacterium]|uniref:Methanolan biosynthesis EpsI domain-containing protein n=1 Tax=BD1-7 clade bacterium TaxID=2029982 RepID=A0A5S9PC30_9GAMM|nr:Uncharacterised protein [BD1-7 clade bacterium]CAA0101398.1 Uncharacterised protein [BD1-7 clade bacterium]
MLSGRVQRFAPFAFIFLLICSANVSASWLACPQQLTPPFVELEKTSLLDPDQQFYDYKTKNYAGSIAIFHGGGMRAMPILEGIELPVTETSDLRKIADAFEVRVLQDAMFQKTTRLLEVQATGAKASGYVFEAMFEHEGVRRYSYYGLWLEVNPAGLKVIRLAIDNHDGKQRSMNKNALEQLLLASARLCQLNAD